MLIPASAWPLYRVLPNGSRDYFFWHVVINDPVSLKEVQDMYDNDLRRMGQGHTEDILVNGFQSLFTSLLSSTFPEWQKKQVFLKWIVLKNFFLMMMMVLF